MDSSKRKHTPGPWVAEVYQSLEEAKSSSGFKWIDRWPEQSRPASVWRLTQNGGKTGLPGSIETTAANAHLIAAAPDLLEALEAFLPGAEAMGWNTSKALAAIAKAKGEAV